MSYQTHLIDQRFRIKTDQFVPAWKVLLAKEYGVTHDFMGEHRPRTLVEVLDGVGLRAEVDEEGNVKAVEWDSGTGGYHLEEFLKDIAPYVHHGSYLKFHDQYGDLTAYRFRNGQVNIETVSMKEDDDE
jgi:hypothetical protein